MSDFVVTRDDFSKMKFKDIKSYCKSIPKLNKIGLIYYFRSPSGKGYVGQTTSNNFGDRMSHHKTKPSCRAFHNAINKYGWKTMCQKFRVLAITDDIPSLNKLEIKYIEEYKTFGKGGYNLTKGGDGIRGYKPSKEQCEANSKRQKKFHEDHPEAREAMSKRARKYYENHPEAREAQSKRAKDPTSKLYAALHSKENKEHLKRASKKAAAARQKSIIATEIKTGTSLTFVSTVEAERKLSEKHNTKFNHSSISRCANKKRKTHKGYTYRFA